LEQGLSELKDPAMGEMIAAGLLFFGACLVPLEGIKLGVVEGDPPEEPMQISRAELRAVADRKLAKYATKYALECVSKAAKKDP
jgi:hypothetical protein